MTPYYQDEAVTIYHGDCREMAEVKNASVDLILTDPPFLTLFGTTDEKNTLGNYTILEGWFNDLLRVWKPLLKPSANMMILCDWRTYPSFWRVALGNNLIPRNLVVWIHGAARHWHMFRYCHQLTLVAQKPPTAPTDVPRGALFDYWQGKNVPTLEREHPTEKPEEYIDYLILAASAEGDLLLDPFLGSGTTAFCAKKLGRKCIGIEIEERYCEIAATRCSQQVMVL